MGGDGCNRYLIEVIYHATVGFWTVIIVRSIELWCNRLKRVDYLHVQADKPWYNYYLEVPTHATTST